MTKLVEADPSEGQMPGQLRIDTELMEPPLSGGSIHAPDSDHVRKLNDALGEN